MCTTNHKEKSAENLIPLNAKKEKAKQKRRKSLKFNLRAMFVCVKINIMLYINLINIYFTLSLWFLSASFILENKVARIQYPLEETDESVWRKGKLNYGLIRNNF